MIRFNRKESLINSALLPPAGGFNFTFKVSFNFVIQTSVVHYIVQNIIYAFVTAG